MPAGQRTGQDAGQAAGHGAGVRPTQAERRAGSERALVDATIDVVASQGVGALTFEAIGRAGGFSRGLASSRFGSKAGLIASVLEDLHRRQEAMLADHGLEAMGGLDAVLTYFDVAIGEMTRSREARAYHMLLCAAIAGENGFGGQFADTHEIVRARLERWIRRGQAEGAIRAEIDPAAGALMVGCLMLGIAMQWLVDPPVAPAVAPTVAFDGLRAASLENLRMGLAKHTG